MKRRNNKLEHCYRSLTVLTRSTTKCTTKPLSKKLDRLAIEFEATAFKAAFCSLFFEFPSQPCQHWTHYIPLSSPLRISFWAWADRQASNAHALPDVRDLRTSGNCCYQSRPFRWPRDQKKRRLWGREWAKVNKHSASDPNACALCYCLGYSQPRPQGSLWSRSPRWPKGSRPLGTRLGYSGPFDWDTSPKSVDREGLGESRAGTRQGSTVFARAYIVKNTASQIGLVWVSYSCILFLLPAPVTLR